MNTEGNQVFVDTNILVYAAVSEAPWHVVARNAIQSYRETGTRLWVSRQVFREYLSTLSRPQTFSVPQPIGVLLHDIERFEDFFSIAEDGPAVSSKLAEILQNVDVGGKQIHDANIVATMLAHNIESILTDNTEDYIRYAKWVNVVPLRTDKTISPS